MNREPDDGKTWVAAMLAVGSILVIVGIVVGGILGFASGAAIGAAVTETGSECQFEECVDPGILPGAVIGLVVGALVGGIAMAGLGIHRVRKSRKTGVAQNPSERDDHAEPESISGGDVSQ